MEEREHHFLGMVNGRLRLGLRALDDVWQTCRGVLLDARSKEIPYSVVEDWALGVKEYVTRVILSYCLTP